jgi:hypothetical protein
LVNKNTKALLVYRKKNGLKVNAEKAKYVVMYSEQNAGQNHNIKIGSKSFESVVQFKYFETTPTNKNYIC